MQLIKWPVSVCMHVGIDYRVHIVYSSCSVCTYVAVDALPSVLQSFDVETQRR